MADKIINQGENNIANKTQKVYLAILNSGKLRREIIATVIPAMRRTEGIELIWENPMKTWANPISSNRNMVVKRFLKTNCDFLLMIDDDVVPLHNPCELVRANMDIIGSPALIASPGDLMVWTAYVKHIDGVGYMAVDLNAMDDMFDMLQVDIVGTGCILIKRKVLEVLKAPFHCEFDEDGVIAYGTDFAFCRKATSAGFKVYTTTHRRCEHYKTIGWNELDSWDSINYFDKSNSRYGMFWGDYHITMKDWHFINDQIEKIKTNKQLRILEFGSGLSSLLLSEENEVISYETNPNHAEIIRARCTDKNNLTIKLWDGHTTPEELKTSINFADNNPRGHKEFDLCFIDGPEPKLKGGIGKEAAIQIASQVSDHVIVCDAGRSEEEQYQRKHLRSIFKLTARSGNHIARCHYWIRRPKPVELDDVRKQLAESIG